MKSLTYLVALGITLSIMACSTQKTIPAPKTYSLIGQWEGCDGRIIEFTKEDDIIIGRCIALGGLGTYGFTLNEVGYEVEAQGNNTYKGRVKWRKTGQKDPFWKNVEITIDGNSYEDQGSDSCGREMARVKS
ncbi:MAG: hypothetical protein AAF466_05100 [Bacteroidota bacterium]